VLPGGLEPPPPAPGAGVLSPRPWELACAGMDSNHRCQEAAGLRPAAFPLCHRRWGDRRVLPPLRPGSQPDSGPGDACGTRTRTLRLDETVHWPVVLRRHGSGAGSRTPITWVTATGPAIRRHRNCESFVARAVCAGRESNPHVTRTLVPGTSAATNYATSARLGLRRAPLNPHVCVCIWQLAHRIFRLVITLFK
jgi:hypothetical protein